MASSPKTASWLKPAIAGTVMIVIGASWGIAAFNNSVQEKATQEKEKMQAEKIAWERERKQQKEESIRRIRKAEAARVEQSQFEQKDFSVPLARQRGNLSGSPAQGGHFHVPPLTKEELAKCIGYSERHDELTSPRAGGYQFKEDRDKELAKLTPIYNVCMATPGRVQQIVDVYNKQIERLLR